MESAPHETARWSGVPAIALAVALAAGCRAEPTREPRCAALLAEVQLAKASGESLAALELAEASEFGGPPCREDLHFALLCEGAHAAAILDAWDRALAVCERAERCGWSPWLGYETGTALVRLGRDDEALAPLERCLAAEPGHVRALQRRAEAFERLGRPREAVASWSAALARIEAAEDAELERLASDRRTLLRESLAGRARAFDALGEFAAAEEDRTRSALARTPGSR